MGDFHTTAAGSTSTLDAETGLTDQGKAIAQEYAKQFVAGVRDKEVEKRHKEMMMVFSAIRVDEEVASSFSRGIFPELAPKKAPVTENVAETAAQKHEISAAFRKTGASATVNKKGELTKHGQEVARRYAMHWLETGERERLLESEFREMRQVFTAIRLDEDMARRFGEG